MGDFKNNSRSFSQRRDLWSRDRTPPQRARDKRETPSTHAPGSSTDSSVKMALTCKVQYLDDTDPFASTNFPEPTRPPTYTFHLNIPLFQQIAGLHRLLNAPHNVSVMLLFIALLSLQLKFCFVVTSVCLNLFHWRAWLCCSDWRCGATAVPQWMLFRSGELAGRASRFVGRFFRQVREHFNLTVSLYVYEAVITSKPTVSFSWWSFTLLYSAVNSIPVFFCSRKNTIILRTALSVRVHNCIGKSSIKTSPTFRLSRVVFRRFHCMSSCLNAKYDLLAIHVQGEAGRVIYNLNCV